MACALVRAAWRLIATRGYRASSPRSPSVNAPRESSACAMDESGPRQEGFQGPKPWIGRFRPTDTPRPRASGAGDPAKRQARLADCPPASSMSHWLSRDLRARQIHAHKHRALLVCIPSDILFHTALLVFNKRCFGHVLKTPPPRCHRITLPGPHLFANRCQGLIAIGYCRFLSANFE